MSPLSDPDLTERMMPAADSEEEFRQICMCVRLGNVSKARDLYRDGVNLNQPLSKWDRRPPLHLAISKLDIDMVCFLLQEAGADPNTTDDKGRTALHIAVLEGNAEIIQLLIDNGGIDFKAVDRWGQTALHLASLCADTAAAKLLLGQCMECLHIRQEDGITPMQIATMADNKQIAALFSAAFDDSNGLNISYQNALAHMSDVALTDLPTPPSLHSPREMDDGEKTSASRTNQASFASMPKGFTPPSMDAAEKMSISRADHPNPLGFNICSETVGADIAGSNGVKNVDSDACSDSDSSAENTRVDYIPRSLSPALHTESAGSVAKNDMSNQHDDSFSTKLVNDAGINPGTFHSKLAACSEPSTEFTTPCEKTIESEAADETKTFSGNLLENDASSSVISNEIGVNNIVESDPTIETSKFNETLLEDELFSKSVLNEVSVNNAAQNSSSHVISGQDVWFRHQAQFIQHYEHATHTLRYFSASLAAYSNGNGLSNEALSSGSNGTFRQISMCVQNGDFVKARKLSLGVNMNQPLSVCGRRPPLHLAICSLDVALLRFLLKECSANPNVTDNKGRTALHMAVLEGNDEIVQLLIDHKGTNFKAIDQWGQTALHLAFCTNTSAAHLLVEYCIDCIHHRKQDALFGTVKCVAEIGASSSQSEPNTGFPSGSNSDANDFYVKVSQSVNPSTKMVASERTSERYSSDSKTSVDMPVHEMVPTSHFITPQEEWHRHEDQFLQQYHQIALVVKSLSASLFAHAKELHSQQEELSFAKSMLNKLLEERAQFAAQTTRCVEELLTLACNGRTTIDRVQSDYDNLCSLLAMIEDTLSNQFKQLHDFTTYRKFKAKTLLERDSN